MDDMIKTLMDPHFQVEAWAVARGLLFLADSLHLERRLPKLAPALSLLGRLLGGKKAR